MDYGFYLYGIFPTPGPRQITVQGLDQQPVKTYTLDGFVFLYSLAQQENYLASRRNLLGHEKVLEQAMEAGYRTLLPLQFGLVISDWQLVQQQLIGPHQEQLHQLFAYLAGRREVGVKVFWDSEAELKLLLEHNLPLREQRDALANQNLSMDQVIIIGQAIEQALGDWQEKIITAFEAALAPLAVATAENELLTNAMIYNGAYLIPWEAEPEFSDRVEALDREFDQRLRIRYNNFTAPYNFARLELLETN